MGIVGVLRSGRGGIVKRLWECDTPKHFRKLDLKLRQTWRLALDKSFLSRGRSRGHQICVVVCKSCISYISMTAPVDETIYECVKEPEMIIGNVHQFYLSKINDSGTSNDETLFTMRESSLDSLFMSQFEIYS
jgi:sulfatase maturation enzyme AslB (radical SAM superfamily)